MIKKGRSKKWADEEGWRGYRIDHGECGKKNRK